MYTKGAPLLAQHVGSVPRWAAAGSRYLWVAGNGEGSSDGGNRVTKGAARSSSTSPSRRIFSWSATSSNASQVCLARLVATCTAGMPRRAATSAELYSAGSRKITSGAHSRTAWSITASSSNPDGPMNLPLVGPSDASSGSDLFGGGGASGFLARGKPVFGGSLDPKRVRPVNLTALPRK